VRITTELQNGTEKRNLGKRVPWFVAIYLASVIAFAVVAGMLSLLVPH
jgi:hypothetical protein